MRYGSIRKSEKKLKVLMAIQLNTKLNNKDTKEANGE